MLLPVNWFWAVASFGRTSALVGGRGSSRHWRGCLIVRGNCTTAARFFTTPTPPNTPAVAGWKDERGRRKGKYSVPRPPVGG